MKIARIITVYRADGTTDTYRITAISDAAITYVTEALTDAQATGEVIDLWESDGRVLIYRDGRRVESSERAPAGWPGSPGDSSNDPASCAGRRRVLRAAAPAADPSATGEALRRFADAFTVPICIGILADELQCDEVNAIAEVLRLGGASEAARQWLAEHASRDCPDGAHPAA